MHEDFGTLLNNGFKSWLRNLNICIPFTINFLIELILYVLFFGLMGMLLFTSSTGGITDTSSLSNQELLAMMWEGFSKNMVLSISLILGFFLFLMFVQSYFTEGAIGMAKKSLETGDTVLSDMLVSGSKNAFRLFLTTLLLTLILFVGIVFLVPGALSIGNLAKILENPNSIQGTAILAVGIILWTTYLIIINLVFSLSTYALVIEEIGPLEALSSGFHFFMNNKLDVFIIWVIYTGLSLINGFAGEFAGSGSILIAASSLVPILILKPLATVLWTRLYLTKKGKKLYDPSYLLSYDSF
jgi:hypothetical protein